MDGFAEFIEIIHKAKSLSQLKDLVTLLTTLDEQQSFGKRIQIIKTLIEGEKTQREIASDLNLSIAKITRGSNALKLISDDMKKFLERQFKSEVQHS